MDTMTAAAMGTVDRRTVGKLGVERVGASGRK
jgi:hypothetical protein